MRFLLAINPRGIMGRATARAGTRIDAKESNMSQLSFDYDASRDSYVAEYRGLTVIAERDLHASNPFTDWDCEPPTLVITGNRNSCIEDYSSEGLESPLALISDGKLRLSRYWQACAKALDLCPAAFRSDCEQEARDYQCSVVTVMREKLEEALSDARPSYYSGNASDYLSALESLWTLAGVPAHHWSSQGYSQGDYAQGLSVATPAWVKKVGAPADTHMRQLKNAGRLWGAWAWGDVYAFVIESPEGEALDSCAGFYGDDFTESGLAQEAKAAADCILASSHKRRLAELKTLIRNRVPLAYRPALLSDAAALDAR
jgi:hypothetical protein